MFTDDHSRTRWGVPIKTKDAMAEGLHALVQEVADLQVSALGKYTAIERRSSREYFRSCMYRLGSSSRLTSRTSLKETLSLSVVLAPFWVLRAASFWGRLNYRADCGVTLLKPRST